MHYVLVTKGKSESPADTVKLECFSSVKAVDDYFKENHKPYSDGYKYWTNCQLVQPSQEVSTYAE